MKYTLRRNKCSVTALIRLYVRDWTTEDTKALDQLDDYGVYIKGNYAYYYLDESLVADDARTGEYHHICFMCD